MAKSWQVLACCYGGFCIFMEQIEPSINLHIYTQNTHDISTKPKHETALLPSGRIQFGGK